MAEEEISEGTTHVSEGCIEVDVEVINLQHFLPLEVSHISMKCDSSFTHQQIEDFQFLNDDLPAWHSNLLGRKISPLKEMLHAVKATRQVLDFYLRIQSTANNVHFIPIGCRTQ